MAKSNLKVNSQHVHYSDDYIHVDYNYLTTKVQKHGDVINVCSVMIIPHVSWIAMMPSIPIIHFMQSKAPQLRHFYNIINKPRTENGYQKWHDTLKIVFKVEYPKKFRHWIFLITVGVNSLSGSFATADFLQLAEPVATSLSIRTDINVPKLGVMLVGWGGNNGSTITAALEANRRKLEWRTKTGVQQANWYGSITQAGTVLLGSDDNGQDVFVPMNDLVPMVNPDDIIIDGWDISKLNIGEAMKRAQVLEVAVQDQVFKQLSNMKPRPSIYDPDFIAANQFDRADNLIKGTRFEQYEQIRQDIRDFKDQSGADTVIVLWTANTERFCDVQPGLNHTRLELEKSLKENKPEISPSTIFAMASIAEKVCYINGSPQNTFVPGLIELAEHHGVFIAGDDFKSGQTKLKSVLVDFLVGAGIKPVSIISYNHLGNNDGKNLSAPQQFRSKEISKSNVVDDMVESNRILYKEDEHPDHVVVIKYAPYVGDSKRAMDEYTSEIMMGGHNTLVIHNTCEDSLLAAPLILDLVILAELCSRINIKNKDQPDSDYQSFRSVLSILSYLCKAPLVPQGTPVINSLFRQRTAIENILRACIGLPPTSHMALEHRFNISTQSAEPPTKRIKTIKTNGITNGNH